MALLAFVFAATWVVSAGMAAHLPRLLQAAGASASGAIAAAVLVGPAQVAARLVHLPLALFGPASYGLRTGVLSVPARVAQAGRRCCSGCCWTGWAWACCWCPPGWVSHLQRHLPSISPVALDELMGDEP